MTQPKNPITVFEKIRQQIEVPGPAAAPGAAAAMFAELNVPAFLEAQAASMRSAGFRAAAELVDANTHVCLSLVPHREAAPDAPEARIDIRVVEGSARPFRARFIYQAYDGRREAAGVCSQYMDAALLNRWFAHFTELCLTAQAVAAEHPATA